MKKKYLKFDWSFYVITLLVMGLGHFEPYLIFALTIIIHECGHLVMAFLYKWELEELKFFGFGGILKFKGELNKSNKEDMLVNSGGVLFNLLFLIILLLFSNADMSLIQLKRYQYLVFAQIFVIVFNLLPIPPLDGSRIFSAILCCFFPYKKVLKITSTCNLVLMNLLLMLVLVFDLRQYFLLLLVIAYSAFKYNGQTTYLFQRFLLQKKLYRNNALPLKNIRINHDAWENHMYRGYQNLFQINSYLNHETKYLNFKYTDMRKI